MADQHLTEKIRFGFWRVWSDLDPRWNGEGECFRFDNGHPTEMFEWQETKAKELGTRPKDLQGAFHREKSVLDGIGRRTQGSVE